VLSQRGVYEKLRDHFICLRMDWEQGNHFKERFGFVPGTGDQMLLDPRGVPISNEDVTTATGDVAADDRQRPNRRRIIFGRNGVDTTPAVLDAVIARHPKKNDALRLEWMLWTQAPARREGGRYPPSIESMAAFARMPIAEIQGRVPPALKDERFLRDHVRQFIWTRTGDDGPSRLVVRRVRDGLPADSPTAIAEIETADGDVANLGRALDAAWLAFMKQRPLVARGYLENEHGGWMRARRDQMITEDEETRRRARDGTLRPPGR
jgi:hypothetical protein